MDMCKRAKRIEVVAIIIAFATSLLIGTACKRSNSSTATNAEAGRNSLNPSRPTGFSDNVPVAIALPDPRDEVGFRILSDYGAVLVVRGGAVPPPLVIFPDDAVVADWQGSLRTMRTDFGGTWIELQSPAMTSLMEARAEAQTAGLQVSPAGSDAGRRSYRDTLKLWGSRVNPGLEHWVRAGQLTPEEAARVRALNPRDQIPEILKLESQGMLFSTDFSKSILYSVAAPGTSQHLSMLAFDLKEHDNRQVRSIMERHGWFQTVASDTPHFTFLGVSKDQLPLLGLRKLTVGERTFWLPNLD